jgi:predicted pyridoxine 5'-phosphate oxidase superfamily flavin-nucleotide-binding protein
VDSAELRELIPEPIVRAANKARPRLHELDRQWLAASPFCLVATAGADGTCDVSPKGDPAGATLVALNATKVAMTGTSRTFDGCWIVQRSTTLARCPNPLVPSISPTL